MDPCENPCVSTLAFCARPLPKRPQACGAPPGAPLRVFVSGAHLGAPLNVAMFGDLARQPLRAGRPEHGRRTPGAPLGRPGKGIWQPSGSPGGSGLAL